MTDSSNTSSCSIYAYYLLLTGTSIEQLKRGDATLYPSHITVRGPFSPRPNVGVDQLAELGVVAFCNLNPLRVCLTGPCTVRSDLVWYEVDPLSESRAILVQTHLLLTQLLLQNACIGVDRIPVQYQGSGYRPHATVVMGTPAPPSRMLRRWPNRVVAEITEWGLFEYRSNEPDCSIVPVMTQPLAGSGTFCRPSHSTRSVRRLQTLAGTGE